MNIDKNVYEIKRVCVIYPMAALKGQPTIALTAVAKMASYREEYET